MPASPRAAFSPIDRSTISCSSAARSRTPGAPSAGIRCACSRRTGRAGCRAMAYDGPDPDGYMSMRRGGRVHRPLRPRLERAGPDRHRRHIGAAGRAAATRSSPAPARSAVAASCSPAAPATSRACRRSPPACRRRSCRSRRSTIAIPVRLPDGGVLVVGGSATGVQLAAEIQQSGRPVTLSVGEHVRLPRTYRGRDVLWWMDASGVWNQRYDEIDDLTRARRLPSPQLVGTADAIHARSQRARATSASQLVGRLAAIRDGRALFSGGLRNVFSLADLKMERLLETFDSGRAPPAATPRSASPSASRRPACRRPRRCSSICARRHPVDRLGHRLPSGLPLAARPGARREGRPAP